MAGDQPPGGEVVEKEQRLGALDDQIVDAHGDQVDADRMMGAGLGRKQHLGADAVGGGDQHRIAEAAGGEVEQAAEAAERRRAPPARPVRRGQRARSGRRDRAPASMSTPASA